MVYEDTNTHIDLGNKNILYLSLMVVSLYLLATKKTLCYNIFSYISFLFFAKALIPYTNMTGHVILYLL